MEILLISYGKWEFDGRLRELVKVLKKIGEPKYITRVKNSTSIQESSHIGVFRNSYIHFIFKAISESLSYKKIDVLILDNRKAIIPGLIINILKKPQNIILDVRELYISKELTHLSGKIGCFFERLMIKKANIVVSANEHRSIFMKDYYNLNNEPLVFENIRQLDCNNEISNNYFAKKYSNIFDKNTIRIISTSGYLVSRTNDKLVEAMSVLGDKFELLLVGGGTEKDKVVIDNIINRNNINNIHFIDMVGADELKYLITNSHIGVVNYHQLDLNNKYCASGKIYEFLFEGLPVVTTENPPLMDICRLYKVGVSDNEYVSGIQTITEKYSSYLENVNEFISKINVDKNNEILANQILDSINPQI